MTNPLVECDEIITGRGRNADEIATVRWIPGAQCALFVIIKSMINRLRSPLLVLVLCLALFSSGGAARDAGPAAMPRPTPGVLASSPAPAATATPTVAPTQAATSSLVRLPPASATLPLTPQSTPEPAVTATAPGELTLPPEAEIRGVTGYGQLFPLSCEARAAADWARYFGITIHELDFLQRLPRSQNPEEGFVGSLNGAWGEIPPEPYGVHAGPVAAVLRGYQAKAVALRGMTLDRLRAEIAAGRPVIVWVTGHVEPGKGVDTMVDGKTVTVARYEHTILVIGYDEKTISFRDGRMTYQRPVAIFQKAWAPLGNMAIVWDETLPSTPVSLENDAPLLAR